jgi:Plasmid pRiA4b ORF-3-like protein
VSDDDGGRAELLRTFESAVSGMELSDLRRLADDLLLMGSPIARREARPELRRPPRSDVAIYRIRVDLDQAEPPIWRRLDVRSDLPLDVVHRVLQAAFGWSDSHLHRFSLGGDPFDRTSQVFLCPYDIEQGEEDDAGGIPTSGVRLDETLQEPDDVLHYVYDYGDSWDLTLRLEQVLPASPDSPPANAVGGRRAAPPENSGGGTDLASLALVVDDPARFDLDELNTALRSPYFLLREYGVDSRLVGLVDRMTYTRIGDDLARRIPTLVSAPTALDDEETKAALVAHRWFLDRAAGGGIDLTSAGYLKPSDAKTACAVVPSMTGWIGKQNRESLAPPLLQFRLSLQSMGLLRKYKGTLLLTRAGAAAQRDTTTLWRHLAARLIPDKPGDFQTAASLLVLAYAGSSAKAPMPRAEVAAALTELGWRYGDGTPLDGHELYGLDAVTTLVNMADPGVADAGLAQLESRVSPAAAALARAALRR